MANAFRLHITVVLVSLIYILVSIFTFLFLFWRRLREDYLSSQIFTTSFYFISGVLGGLWLSVKFFPGFWFWLAVLFGFLGIGAGILKFKLKAYEVIDAWIYASLPVVFLSFLYNFSQTQNLASLFISLAIISLFSLFVILNNHYRKFTWYKSGKIGFSGLTVAGIFFLARSVIAIVKPDMISFVGRLDAVISGSLAFGCFLILFNLAKGEE